jgi:hypothetical protein
MQTVFVVMGEGDNGGTLPEHTLRVFLSPTDADKYVKQLRDSFFSCVSIMEREVETEYTPNGL